MEDLLGLTTPAPLSLATLAFNLLISIILSGTLAWVYTRFGTSLSNRARFSQALPLLAMTTVLVISVVKSSLALSLGLVGALSIIRFRTAIKEPEELLYLFMSMVIGVGLGADQRGPTIVAVIIIVAFLLVRTLALPRKVNNNLYLNVMAPTTDQAALQIRDILLKHTSGADLRRMDSSATSLQATYLVSLSNDEALFALMDALRAQLPACEVSFVEQDNSLGA
ncbi:MAG: DUF4956 domain-containing protein [Anaerolineae bacterium]|nr:DUF4956 domain-containing protein [Anaerolineae bacterium]